MRRWCSGSARTPGVRMSPPDTRVAELASDGGCAEPDAWLHARTSLRHDIDAAWIAQCSNSHPLLTRRVRGSAARVVKRLR